MLAESSGQEGAKGNAQSPWVNVLGCAGVLAVLVVGAWHVLPRLALMEQYSSQGKCKERLQRVAGAVLLFASQNDGCLPDTRTWRQDVLPYLNSERDLECYALVRYALNPQVAGRGVSAFSDDERRQMVLLYEADKSGQPACPHHDGANYAFLDGHVRWLPDPPEGFQPAQVVPGAPQAHGKCSMGHSAPAHCAGALVPDAVRRSVTLSPGAAIPASDRQFLPGGKKTSLVKGILAAMAN